MELTYAGNELPLFERAKNWKAYWHSHIRRYLVGEVLEVGAGIGAATEFLCDGRQKCWTALEPDPALAEQIRHRLGAHPFAAAVEVLVGTTEDLADRRAFDAVLYIDVLEHIEADRAELARAAALLRPGGALIVLAPAHQWLYTPFDERIGHYRRYSARALEAVVPPGLIRERVHYLDSVGLLASLGNRLVLSSGMPTARQLWVWDSLLVRLSRWVDPVLRHRLGKSVLGIWRRP